MRALFLFFHLFCLFALSWTFFFCFLIFYFICVFSVESSGLLSVLFSVSFGVDSSAGEEEEDNNNSCQVAVEFIVELEDEVDSEENEVLDDSSYILFSLLLFKVELISSLLLLG